MSRMSGILGIILLGVFSFVQGQEIIKPEN